MSEDLSSRHLHHPVPPDGAAPWDRGAGADDEPLPAVVARLRDEVEQLRRAQRHRGVIEQAKGVLMARLGVDPEEAFQRLVSYSQRTNQKLTRCAAAVVAATITSERPVASGPHGTEALALLDAPRWEGRHGPAADGLLASASLDAAGNLGELLRIALGDTASAVGADAGLLALLEPDGALRLVAGQGYDETVMSAWHRIPPTLDVPLHAAVVSQAPVLLADRRERVDRFPLTSDLPSTYEGQASLPLFVDGRLVGVFGVAFARRVRFDEPMVGALTCLAERVSAPFLRLAERDGDALDPVAVGVPSARWFRAALDAVLIPCAVLEPVRDDGTVVDFRIGYTNAAASRFNASSFPDGVQGRRLLELLPHLVDAGLYERFLDVLQRGWPQRIETAQFFEDAGDGLPQLRLVDLAVARLGDGLLMSWIEPDRILGTG
jgi:hypothetical protein